MQLTQTPLNLRRDRPQRRQSNPRPVVSAATARDRRAASCEDHALYACSCGCAFKAEVSTTVGCPRCGTAQAW
jgi:hypothetical protein